MRIKREDKLILEPPSLATGDIAFLLIVFFLVCLSIQPDTGRTQEIPKAETKPEKKNQSKNIEVALGQSSIVINGNPIQVEKLSERLTAMLESRKRPEDRIVVVKTGNKKDTPYQFWIKVVRDIEAAGGVVTLQLEEERVVETD